MTQRLKMAAVVLLGILAGCSIRRSTQQDKSNAIAADCSDDRLLLELHMTLGHYFRAGTDAFVVYQGMPFDLAVTLRNPNASRALEKHVADEVQARKKTGVPLKLSEMRSQVADQLLKSGVVRAVRVGTRAVPWYRFIKLTVTDRKGDEALKGEDWAAKHIDHNATGEDNLVRFLGKGSSWCLSPEDTQHLPIGEYSVGAIFDTLGVDNESDVRQLKLHSNALRVFIREAKTFDERAWAAFATADYLSNIGQVERAVETAKKGLEAAPNLNELHSILGRLYDEKKDYIHALAESEKALELYYKQTGAHAEPPEALLIRIHQIKENISNEKNNQQP